MSLTNNFVICRQSGVIRTNCIDCLDRTNVIQSLFATYVLTCQLGASNLESSNIKFFSIDFNNKLSNRMKINILFSLSMGR